ncbi:MAM domain-containing glycosylphosphatidylinositol anchor protein 2-like [Amphiura filiformis]|uniref:MAM domain-containing glycosylphosphatidylinositol anchor protein 2-like n=1 Tax=Amphiura filiformis TaxID=82378 RepID=UPI003B21D37B
MYSPFTKVLKSLLFCVSLVIFKGPEYVCDFDDNDSPLCDYTQATDDDFDWTRHSGSTPSSITGPDGDHTTGSGHYIYIETSDPRVAGDTASLISPLILGNTGGSDCRINFWCHMYGVDMGTLRVYAKTASGGDTELWSASGNHGDQWVFTSLSHYIPQTDFKVAFVGVRGPGYAGDIALDDIEISGCGFQGTTEPPELSTYPTTTIAGETPGLLKYDNVIITLFRAITMRRCVCAKPPPGDP